MINAKQLVTLIIIIVVLLTVGLVTVPIYNVWSKEMAGKAMLAEATHTRQVQVEQARAELEAATMRADAIRIIGEVAQKYPEYRTQEFIGAFAEALKEGKINQIMYVPTEANIPITEATRLK